MQGLTTLISLHDCELTIRALEFYVEAYDLESDEKMQANALLNWIKLQVAKSKFENNQSK
jgi:hypothetical protein